MRTFFLLVLLTVGGSLNAQMNLRSAPYAASLTAPAVASAPSYILSDGFETNSLGQWTIQNDTNGVHVYQTTNVIEETSSYVAQGLSGSAALYIYNTTLFTADDCYVFFYLKLIAGETADDYTRAFCWIVDSGNNHLVTLSIYRLSSTQYKMTVEASFEATVRTVATFNVGSTNAVWIRSQKGTGANQKAQVWWCNCPRPGIDAIKPADGSDNYAESLTGQYTTSNQRLQIGAEYGSAQTLTLLYDHVRVSSTAIGNNPP